MSPTEPAVGTPLLAVTGLRKRFGEHEVLRSVDLTVRTGEVVAVIGSSGSGKTTLLRCLNGLEVAYAGTVAVGDGVTIDFAARPSLRQLNSLCDRSAMVFQHYNLFPHKTVLENITEGPVVVQRRPPAEAREEARGHWNASGSRTGPTRIRSSSRAASSSAWGSCERSRCGPTCCCSTSRRPPWTPSWSATS